MENNGSLWDPTIDSEASAWWDEYNLIDGEKYYILNWYEDLGYTWTTAIASISWFDNVIKFDDYFKVKKEYEGYIIGKEYGI